MIVNYIEPRPFLTDYIRFNKILDDDLPEGITIPVKVYSPRPEYCLQFYVRCRSTIVYPDSRVTIATKTAALIGQHTIINHRQVNRGFIPIETYFI